MMKKMLFAVVLSLSSLFLLSCTASSEPSERDEQQKATRMTVVSSGKAANFLPSFKTYSWNQEYSRVLSALNDASEEQIQQYLRSEIALYLKTKGYVYQPDAQKADLVVGYLFALEDDLADREIQSKFGLLPGVASRKVSNARYEKGSLLIAFLDKDLKRVYWRSAMQGFVDFEKDRQDGSTNHIQSVLGLMLSGVPQAGK